MGAAHEGTDSRAQRKDNKDLSPIERHHSKAITATASAHIGLQTKQDLPVDDKFFKCFVTSNADAYVNQFPAHQRALEKEGHKSPPKSSGRMSNIQQGDLNHYTDYTTMHDSSFVPHHPEDYKRPPAKGPKTQTSIVFGHTHPSGDPSMYVSTSTAAHQIPTNKDLTPKFDASKVRGRSCIVFGDPDKVNGSPSVSQRDYHSYGTDCLLDNLNSKRRDTHVSSITSALAPDGRSSLRDMGSCTSLSYRAPGVGNRDERPAGIECGQHGGKLSNISSIPTGDALMFPFGSSYTTTELDFAEHPRMHPVEHPVLGAKMTQSTVSFGEQGGAMDMSNDERYTSTTHSAFVPHPESVAVLGRGVSVKPRVALETEDANWSSYPMSQNKTTHTDHYQTPGPSERAHGIKGKLVPRKMLFPLRNHRSFATVTAESFAMRAGLQFDTKDLRDKRAEEEAVRKFRTKSSIAFGDASRPVAPLLN